ncbi:hypothetical protein [Streptomyces sp. NPDC002588]|uniref:hypothetical protein n=1 Tax=Streptomyces sp. NPDC002588 TaxID=3154419 RepID=UPI003326EF8B
MRLTPPDARTRRTARSVGLTTLLALTSVTALAAAPTASAASTASLTVEVPAQVRGEGTSVVSFGSLRIDDGTSVTCVSDYDVSGVWPRPVIATDYQVTAGTTYGISAWEGAKCDWDDPATPRRTQSLGGVTVTPTAADVSSGVYRVSIP